MKTTTKTVIEVDYNEVDTAINAFLQEQGAKVKPHDYQLVCYQEWGNYESHDVDVDGCVDDDDIAEIMEGKLHWKLNDIMNWMAREGKLEKGEYKIDISW